MLRGIAEEYRCGFEALVKQDLAVFEERRLQDVLLCRAQAACYSVGGGDLQRGWEQRLSQLNHNRGDYLQVGGWTKTISILLVSFPKSVGVGLLESI